MSKHQKLLDWIEGELISQNLRLGDQLPDDKKLARATGLSQNHVRESLKHCEEIGVVRLYEGKRKTILGTLLREPAVSAGTAMGLYVASSASPQQDLLQTCLLLENYALSVSPAHAAAYPELERILGLMADPETTMSDFHDLEADFHIQLGQLSGNALISALLATLRDSMIEARFSLVTQVPLWSATATRLRMEYRAILDAVKSGDPVLARTLLKANLEERFAEAEHPLTLDEVEVEDRDAATSVVPVEVEDRELVPEEWGGHLTPDLFDALQNIQPKGSPVPASAPAQASALVSEPAEVSDAPQGGDEKDAQSTEKEAEDRGESQLTETQDAGHPAPPTGQVPEAEAPPVPEEPAARTVLRAVPTGSATRRRRGTVSSVVHATVLTPPVRSEGSARSGADRALTQAEAPQKPLQYRVQPEELDELNRIERDQATVKARLAAAAQKRRQAREQAEAEAAERAAAERAAAEQAEAEAAEAARLEAEAQEAQAARELEAKLLAEEQRLAAQAAQTAQEADSLIEVETPKGSASAPRKRFGVMEYFGFRQQTSLAPEPAGSGGEQTSAGDDPAPETAAFELPEGYESAESGSVAEPEYIDETQPADGTEEVPVADETPDSETQEEALTASSPLNKKKRGKKKKR